MSHMVQIYFHTILKQVTSLQRQRVLPQIHSNFNKITSSGPARNITRRQSLQGSQMLNRLCKTQVLNKSYSTFDSAPPTLLSTQILENQQLPDDNFELVKQDEEKNSLFTENKQMLLKNLHEIDEIIMEVQEPQHGDNISIIDLTINIKNNIQHLHEYDDKLKHLDYQSHLNNNKLQSLQASWTVYMDIFQIYQQSTDPNAHYQGHKKTTNQKM